MKKRLLFVNHSSELMGGANDDFIRLLKYFSLFKDKYIITGLYPEGPNVINYSKYCDESYIYSEGFFPVTNQNILHYYGFLKIYFKQKNEIKKLLEDREFDLCIFNVVVMFWIVKWMKNKNIKSIIFIREMIIPEFLRKLYYRLISGCGNFFISVSDKLEKDFKAITGKNEITTLYSSIEKELNYESESENVKSQIMDSDFKKILLSDIPKFINIGAINDRKNQFMILESAKILKEKLKDEIPYFVFIGPELDSAYGDKLKKYILREKLSDKCFLLGQRDKIFIYNLLSHMSGMIISSKSEGLPLVLVEALRFRLPLISTKAGGITDIIKNGYNGLLIDNNKECLAEAVIKIINDKDLHDRIIENGYKTYTEKFNLERNLLEINNIIEKLSNQ